MEFLYEYGLFLAKVATFVAAILIVIAAAVGAASRQNKGKGQLDITSLSEQIEQLTMHAKQLVLSKDAFKKLTKEKKKQDKNKDEQSTNLFVIDFKGSMDAHEVECLREEISAILHVASDKDEVLVRLESGGGVVHGYGLAASQLQRIKDANIKLTVCVDKVAASGGYMMACVADKVIAARFAIIGSIGVIAQLPNFNKVLKKHDIEFEQHTAGQFKRTLTLFGENNEAGRQKFREELEDVHQMFKTFVQDNRAELDIDNVATGEYWYGAKAHELGLVDEIGTSDDVLMKAVDSHKIFSVKYSQKRNVAEKLGLAAAQGAEALLGKIWQKSTQPFQ
ncbi:protease SohB [Aestuariibacter salexigens]|uniref:protease SohB n=1 Tax=Aestuariibacter salexigens TaxID=226010 RepID=UPI00041B1D09|nr:protease SohB [Aestuariibacter salexigens]